MRRHGFLPIFLVVVWLFILFSGSIAANAKTAKEDGKSGQEAQTRLSEPYTPEQVDAILARMSDSQVRSLLIQELQKDAAATSDSSDEGLLQEVGDEAGQAHTRLAKVPGADGVPVMATWKLPVVAPIVTVPPLA